MIKVLSRRPLRCVPSLLVNQADSEDEALGVARRVRTVAKRFLNLDIEYWGCVLADESVSKSVQRQEPFLSTYPTRPRPRASTRSRGASSARSRSRPLRPPDPTPSSPAATSRRASNVRRFLVRLTLVSSTVAPPSCPSSVS